MTCGRTAEGWKDRVAMSSSPIALWCGAVCYGVVAWPHQRKDLGREECTNFNSIKSQWDDGTL
jgi:hypothetical protein